MLRHHLDGREDVLKGLVVDEVVEVHAHPARLDALAAAGDLTLELLGARDVDPEEPVPVGTGAGATAARLDPEEIIQDCNDEVVVQEAPFFGAILFHDERHDREARRIAASKNVQRRVLLPAPDRRRRP